MSLDYVKFSNGFEKFMPKEYRDMVEHGPFGKKVSVSQMGSFKEVLEEHPMCAGCAMTLFIRLAMIAFPNPEDTITVGTAGCGRLAISQAAIPFVYDPGTSREKIDEDLNVRRPWFPRAEAYSAQLQGILAWEAYSRLDQINTPTLVIHGENDLMVPPGNGELIANRIPGAKLVLIPNAGHIFTTDQPEASQQAVSDFLAEQNL